jgi:hypothetical protein
MRRALFVVGLLALAALPARANGRFPATTSVTFRPGHPQEITLGSTVGLLLSKDGGNHFYWVCDRAVFGDSNNSFDPDYHVATDGTLYANTTGGLRISRDGGCTYDIAQVESLTMQKWVDGMDLGPNDEVWIAQADGGRPNDVFESTDAGAHWTSKGLLSPTIWWKTVKVARSNPMRVYVSGYEVTQTAPDGGTIAPLVHIKRTDNGGSSWTELPTTDFTFGSTPIVLLAAVSPTDPNVLFAVSVDAGGPMKDKLYRSTNGGMSWSFVLDTRSSLRKVVFLADGSVLVASVMDVWQAPSPTGTFAPLTKQLEMACAAQREDGAIFGCGANWDPDNMALGTSAASPVGPWTKVFRFVDMAGPLACPTGTVQHDECQLVEWPTVKEQFGITDPMVDGAPADAAVTTPPRKSGGCCDSGGSDGAATAVIVALAVVIGGLLVRRGKRKKKCCQ